MNQHEWISIPSDQKSEIGYMWCRKCGTLRVEYYGEADPYEYYALGFESKLINGHLLGLSEDPGCKELTHERINN